MVSYFKYKIRKLVGYAKIAEQSNVKFLIKCKIEGFYFMRRTPEYIYFKIENKLYRQLKLYHLGNEPASYKIKSLYYLIDKSEKIQEDESNKYDYSSYDGYWYNEYTYYEDNEIALKKDEYKDRIRNQNKHYNLKLKR